MTKVELRQMLTEAVRNTPSPDQPKHPAKARKLAVEARRFTVTKSELMEGVNAILRFGARAGERSQSNCARQRDSGRAH